MGDRTSIEWTEATWNPVTGCTKVSPGCDRCYAESIAHRFAGTPAYPNGFQTTLRPERLDQPLRWTRPRKVFVCSMADLFHDDVPDEYIAHVWAVMALAGQHTFQVLTKRQGRMRSLLSSGEFIDQVQEAWEQQPGDDGPEAYAPPWPLPNVWLGVSAEDQKRADLRIPALLNTPAAVRWVSAEPLLGPIDLSRWQHEHPIGENLTMRPLPPSAVRACGLTGIDWLVVGGESGRGARPMHPDWARSLRDQCAAADVPFLFKQWGQWGPAPWSVRVCDPNVGCQGTDEELAAAKAEAERTGATHALAPSGHLIELSHKPWSIERDPKEPAPHAGIRRYGKKAAGRTLDGCTHDAYPAEATA
jgi:protein gp37